MHRIAFATILLLWPLAALAADDIVSIPRLPSIEAMESLGTAALQYPIVTVQAYYVGGSSGGGIFTLQTSGATPNNCTIFSVTGQPSLRWARLWDGVNLPIANCGPNATSTVIQDAAMLRGSTLLSTVHTFVPGNVPRGDVGKTIILEKCGPTSADGSTPLSLITTIASVTKGTATLRTPASNNCSGKTAAFGVPDDKAFADACATAGPSGQVWLNGGLTRYMLTDKGGSFTVGGANGTTYSNCSTFRAVGGPANLDFAISNLSIPAITFTAQEGSTGISDFGNAGPIVWDNIVVNDYYSGGACYLLEGMNQANINASCQQSYGDCYQVTPPANFHILASTLTLSGAGCGLHGVEWRLTNPSYVNNNHEIVNIYGEGFYSCANLGIAIGPACDAHQAEWGAGQYWCLSGTGISSFGANEDIQTELNSGNESQANPSGWVIASPAASHVRCPRNNSPALFYEDNTLEIFALEGKTSRSPTIDSELANGPQGNTIRIGVTGGYTNGGVSASISTAANFITYDALGGSLPAQLFQGQLMTNQPPKNATKYMCGDNSGNFWLQTAPC